MLFRQMLFLIDHEAEGRNTNLFKGLRPPAADPQQNEGMMLRGYENHEAIALVTCAS